MKNVQITKDFEGYPNGSGEGIKRSYFKIGEEHSLKDDYADLVIKEGLAKEVKKAPKEEPKETVKEEKKDATSKTQ